MAGMFTCATQMYAQAVKLGHISAAELLQQMPEVKKADSTMAGYQKALEDQYSQMVQEFQGKSSDYDKNTAAKTWSDAVADVKAQELKDLEKRIQDFQQSAQEKITTKRQEIYAPIYNKATEAIKAVGKENGYSYIFDSSSNNAVIYAQESQDVMPLVKKKLGLK